VTLTRSLMSMLVSMKNSNQRAVHLGLLSDTTSHDVVGLIPARERKRVFTRVWPRTSCSPDASRSSRAPSPSLCIRRAPLTAGSTPRLRVIATRDERSSHAGVVAHGRVVANSIVSTATLGRTKHSSSAELQRARGTPGAAALERRLRRRRYRRACRSPSRRSPATASASGEPRGASWIGRSDRLTTRGQATGYRVLDTGSRSLSGTSAPRSAEGCHEPLV
jgi:hypothetical protein